MKIHVAFSETNSAVNLIFGEQNKSFALNFGEVTKVTEYIGGELYEGDYTVTPKVKAQTLPTAEKVMVDDLQIKAIPFYNVGNTSGGSTVYIGNEV